MQTLTIHLLSLASLLSAPQDPGERAAGAPQSLDGTQWALSVREADIPNDRGPELQEILYFHQGTLRSRLASRRGFGRPTYESRNENGEIHFEARGSNSRGHSVSWRGVVQGDAVTGTIEITETPDRSVAFVYRGMRSPTLEGTRWLTTLTALDDQSGISFPPVNVRITFWNGLATTTREGAGAEFQPAIYRISLDDVDWTLEFDQESIEGQRRQWQAVIEDDRMFGSAERSRPGGNVIAYDLDGRRLPTLEGTVWNLTFTGGTGQPVEPASLVFRAGRVEIADLFGSSLPAGSYQMTWAETRWRLVIGQIADSTTRIWTAWLDDDRLEGRVVQTADGQQTSAEFTGTRR